MVRSCHVPLELCNEHAPLCSHLFLFLYIIFLTYYKKTYYNGSEKPAKTSITVMRCELEVLVVFLFSLFVILRLSVKS